MSKLTNIIGESWRHRMAANADKALPGGATTKEQVADRVTAMIELELRKMLDFFGINVNWDADDCMSSLAFQLRSKGMKLLRLQFENPRDGRSGYYFFEGNRPILGLSDPYIDKDGKTIKVDRIMNPS